MLEEFSHHLTYGLLSLEKVTHLAHTVDFVVYISMRLFFFHGDHRCCFGREELPAG
jgi:hypothetical protein